MRTDRRTHPIGQARGPSIRHNYGRRRKLIDRTLRSGLLVAAGVVLLDQLTKVWAVAALDDGPIDIFGEVLQFRLTRNPGAAFSSFTGGGPVIGVIAAVVAVVIAVILPRLDLAVDRFALALIMGGALGNLTDRIFRGDGFLDGAVVDFISPSFFPSFNVADSAITIGVALMLWSSIFNQEHHQAAAANQDRVVSSADRDPA